MPKASESKPEAPSFESAISRLEHLVEEMDSASLPLQELISRYEEGVQLVKVCEQRLKEAEKRIEIITRDSSGKPQAEPFNPEAKAAAPEPRADVSLF